MTSKFVVHAFAIAAVLPTGVVASARAQAPPAARTLRCDEACLLAVMADALKALSTGRAGSIPLADLAEVRQNAQLVALSATAWKDVKAIRSTMTFADAVSGNVVSRAGVELATGKPGYISTRLKVTPDRRIADVEISADTSASVVSAYVWNLDPVFSEAVPAAQRMARVDLEALARRYFHSLSSHVATRADFDERCNRFHSGQQITNVRNDAVEGGPARTCASSLEGTPPWGPATEHRFPVIDVERGVVLGLTLLHFPKLPDQPKMYVSELFKVVGGKIVRIDNIGLMLTDVESLGFLH